MSNELAPLTSEQAAVVGAYTGYLVGSFITMQTYIEERLGRPVWHHELPSIRDEIQTATHADFLALVPEEER